MRKTIKNDVHYDIGKCFVFELSIYFIYTGIFFYFFWYEAI